MIITISPSSLLGQVEEILRARLGLLFSYVTFILSQALPRVSAGKASLSRVSLDALKHVGVREHLDGIKLPSPFPFPDFTADVKIMRKIFAERGKFFVFRQRRGVLLKNFASKPIAVGINNHKCNRALVR